MTDYKDIISKALLTGALNVAANMLIFQGTGRDIIDFRIPFLGNIEIPDSAVLFASGAIGQAASDVAHDYIFKAVNPADKMKGSESFLASLASYNAAQLPILFLGKMNASNVAPYLLMSSGIHYASENIYHDVLSKRTGGLVI